MSIDAKNELVANVEQRLEEDLTVSKMRRITQELTDALNDYDVEIKKSPAECDNDDLMNVFVSAKSVEGRSYRTIDRYKYIINDLKKYTNMPLGKITIHDIRSYLTYKKEHGVSDNTLNGCRSIFCSVFGWLYNEKLLKNNPTANLSAIKCMKKVRLPYSYTDIEMIKENCKTVRDKAIVCMLYSTGARVNEICGLNRNDIDIEKMEATVLGKGNKQRTVYIDEITCMMLKRYLETRDDNLEPLFIGKRKERLTTDGVRRMLKVIAEKSGVTNVHPHRFRRTLATNLINHGMPIQEVSVILGHESIKTTMEYIFTQKTNVKNSYRKYL